METAVKNNKIKALVAELSYGDFWCTGREKTGWRILLVDLDQDHNQQRTIRHDQVYLTSGPTARAGSH